MSAKPPGAGDWCAKSVPPCRSLSGFAPADDEGRDGEEEGPGLVCGVQLAEPFSRLCLGHRRGFHGAARRALQYVQNEGQICLHPRLGFRCDIAQSLALEQAKKLAAEGATAVIVA